MAAQKITMAVTGASGHIGVNLCRQLVEKGYRVKTLVHRNTDSLKDIRVETISGNLKDLTSLSTLVEEADVVFHLAAKISIRGNKAGELFETNVEGTRNILQAAKQVPVKKFIHFSTIHALVQEPYDQVLDETRPLASQDKMAYSRSKALAEEAVLQAVDQGLDAVILNPTAVIGPYDYTPSHMGRALILLASGKLPALVPGGYDWVDVRDVVEAACSAAENGKKGERYLLSGHWRTLSQIVEMVFVLTQNRYRRPVCPFWLARLGIPFLNLYCSLYDKQTLYTRDSLYALRTSHQNISHEKASNELGFKTRPLEETVKDTLDWFKDNGYLA